VILSALLGANVPGLALAALGGAAAGAVVGLLVGESAESIAGGIGGAIGALSAAVLVLGARRRGATRFGLAALLGVGGIVLALAALIPVLGYLEATLVPVVAARMRTRQAQRFAGLRTLAK
jgi:hypothetical protein